jgi:hypothetical protein
VSTPGAAPTEPPSNKENDASTENSASQTTSELVPVLQSEIADQAQTKVDSRSRFPVTIFGTLLYTAGYAAGTVDSSLLPSLSQVSPLGVTNPFITGVEQSRIGAYASGPRIGAFQASGYAAADFFGGQGSWARVVYAYGKLQSAHTTFEAGQDDLIFAPTHPRSLSSYAIPELYRAGTLYARAPQLRVEQRIDTAGETAFTVAGAFTGPVQPEYNVLGPQPNYRRPGFEGRLAWGTRSYDPEENGFQLAVSGERDPRDNAPPGISRRGTSADFRATLGHVGVGGSYYTGQDLGAFGGGVGQEGRTHGGFVDGRLRVTRRVEFNAGAGVSRWLRGTFEPAYSRNTGVFANTIVALTPEVRTSLEYQRLRTTNYYPAPLNISNGVSLAIAYSF